MYRIRGRKVVAFILLNIIYASIYFVTLFVHPLVLFANGITFIGGNTLDKWIKSKWYQKELDNER